LLNLQIRRAQGVSKACPTADLGQGAGNWG
jgi:hypothetical protein